MFNIKDTLAYQAAKPTKNDLGLRTYQLQLGEEALKAEELAQALKWFTLAALPRATDALDAEASQQRIRSELLLEQTRIKIAAIEMQKSPLIPRPNFFSN